jgi:carbonic anhydrase
MHAQPGLSRRHFLKITGVAAGSGLGAVPPMATGQDAGAANTPRFNPDQALRELLAGNQRFVDGKPTAPGRTPAEFRQLAAGQSPFAAIIGCADSRVAPEILFDVGKGDIFVVRVAGNLVSGAGAAVLGSVEYAVAELSVPLILILGHGNCGAVKSAMQHIDARDSLPGAINGLVELIKPAVAQSMADPGDPLDNAIRRNVHLGVEHLTRLEPIIAPRVKEGKVRIAGGVYDLQTGKVNLVT